MEGDVGCFRTRLWKSFFSIREVQKAGPLQLMCSQNSLLQHDWPWVAEWDLRWHFRCICLISKPRPVLDVSSKNQGSFFNNFFEKSKNELVQTKTMFWAILAKIWSFSNIATSLKIFVINWLIVLSSYRLYFSISIDLDRHEFWRARSVFEQKHSSWTS